MSEKPWIVQSYLITCMKHFEAMIVQDWHQKYQRLLGIPNICSLATSAWRSSSVVALGSKQNDIH